MKLVFFGDSVTDSGRSRERDGHWTSYGYGFVRGIAGELLAKSPNEYTIVNRGIGGNTILDLYARIKMDVWNENPDVLTILVGVNDLSQEIADGHGVELPRFEKVYAEVIKETMERFPLVKIILCEPFVLHGSIVDMKFEQYSEVKHYGEIVEKLAKKFGCIFLPLQKKLSNFAEQFGVEHCLVDGVHPNIAGATIIAKEWLETFEKEVVAGK